MVQWIGCSGGLSFQISAFFFFPQKYQDVELLDRMVVLLLMFWGTSILFSIAAVPIYDPTNSAKVFPFLHILAWIYLLSFNASHSNDVRWYLMVVMIYISPMISDDHLFMGLLAICTFSLESIYSGNFAILIELFVICCWVIWVCILDISTLSDTWFANFFPLFCWWFSLLCRGFLVWCGPLYLLLLTLCVIFKKSLSRPQSWSFFLLFSSRSFVASSLTFKSWIHFE